jgi:hypothetical protein
VISSAGRGTLVVDSAGLAPGYVPPSASLTPPIEDVVVGDYISDIQAELDRIDPPDHFEIPHTIVTDEEWERA